MIWRIGITDYVQSPFSVEREAVGQDFVFVDLTSKCLSEWDDSTLSSLDAVLVWHECISENIASRLKPGCIVVRYGVGYDNIDLDAIDRYGLLFSNTPDYGTEEVADTAVAMIMSLVRQVPAYDRMAATIFSGWQEHVLPDIKRTAELTIGIIGVGRIGTSLLLRMKPFGGRLVGYDPFLPSGHEKSIGYQRVQSVEELLEMVDVVSIHCPLSVDTMGMIDGKFLSRLKKGCILINTARGGLIRDLDCIQEKIESGYLAGVGLDVLPDEPPGEHPFIRKWRDGAYGGRVLITNHTAYYSQSSWFEMRHKAAETAALYLRSGELRNMITDGREKHHG